MDVTNSVPVGWVTARVEDSREKLLEIAKCLCRARSCSERLSFDDGVDVAWEMLSMVDRLHKIVVEKYGMSECKKSRFSIEAITSKSEYMIC